MIGPDPELDQQKAARILASIVTGDDLLRQRDEQGRFVGPADAGASGPPPKPAKTQRDFGLDLLSALDGEGADHRGGQRWTG